MTTTPKQAKLFTVKPLDRQITRQDKVNATLVYKREVLLNKEKCEEFFNLPRFREERAISLDHIQALFDEMVAGRFREELVELATCEWDDVTYLINGQHTCWAVWNMLATKGHELFNCNVQQLHYRVKSEDELRKIYSVFDPQIAARSSRHLMKVMLAGSVTEGVWSSALTFLASGWKLWQAEDKDDRHRLTPVLVANDMEANATLVTSVAEFWQDNQNPHLKRAAVSAALFATFSVVPTKAREFWQPVADGIGLNEKNDPRYTLREWLMTSSVHSLGNKEKKQVGAEEMYRICIIAWNKYRNGEKAILLRVSPKRVKPV